MANPNPSPATRFKEGNPGGPGAPKGRRTLTSIIREVLDSRTIKGEPIPEGRTVADVLVDVFVTEAMNGNFSFAKEIIERIDGKVAQKIQVEDDRKAYDVANPPDTL